ncbi:MAG: acetylglutamate kinase [Candidatus Methanomethylophilaceae archaeon]|nr:acetylglutamate kinase [Candidatus Methanomethylophilaceae archaeon]MDI3542052.1 acetylglutamate kinase [Candidatus Methanomethylophilaceae archaeon]
MPMHYYPIKERFPRLEELRDSHIVIKFGGNAIAGDDELKRFAKDVAMMCSLGMHPVLVHGGGPEITKEMKLRGLEARKVAGLRITDSETLEVAEYVLGRMNREIVKALRGAGVDAVGVPGYKNGILRCKRKDPILAYDENGNLVTIDLGYVGDVEFVDIKQIMYMTASGMVPVIYPIGEDVEGGHVNVNADTAAAHIAAALNCEEMILITDVPGILTDVNDENSLIREVSIKQIDELISGGVVKEGMVPKVEACRLALNAGVRSTYMLGGKEAGNLLRQILDDNHSGTRIVKG